MNKPRALSTFSDIHTHDLGAGDDSVINLPWGMDVPPTGYYSIGIHPWDSETATDADVARLEALATHPRIVAIGEAGMDALRGGDLHCQERLFRRHIAISEAVGKPLIIHAVRTLSDIMRLRKELKPSQAWIIHGYRGKPETAQQLIAIGIDISLGERHHPDIIEAVAPEHLYHETDAQP